MSGHVRWRLGNISPPRPSALRSSSRDQYFDFLPGALLDFMLFTAPLVLLARFLFVATFDFAAMIHLLQSDVSHVRLRASTLLVLILRFGFVAGLCHLVRIG